MLSLQHLLLLCFPALCKVSQYQFLLRLQQILKDNPLPVRRSVLRFSQVPVLPGHVIRQPVSLSSLTLLLLLNTLFPVSPVHLPYGLQILLLPAHAFHTFAVRCVSPLSLFPVRFWFSEILLLLPEELRVS